MVYDTIFTEYLWYMFLSDRIYLLYILGDYIRKSPVRSTFDFLPGTTLTLIGIAYIFKVNALYKTDLRYAYSSSAEYHTIFRNVRCGFVMHYRTRHR